MREIVNISLPEKLNKAVEKTIKKDHYATKSEFFRDIIRMWLEGKILKELSEGRKELSAGKGKADGKNGRKSRSKSTKKNTKRQFRRL